MYDSERTPTLLDTVTLGPGGPCLVVARENAGLTRERCEASSWSNPSYPLLSVPIVPNCQSPADETVAQVKEMDAEVIVLGRLCMIIVTTSISSLDVFEQFRRLDGIQPDVNSVSSTSLASSPSHCDNTILEPLATSVYSVFVAPASRAAIEKCLVLKGLG